MRILAVIAGATIVTASLVTSAAYTGVPISWAEGQPWGINGTYIATSNGGYARTNDVFHDEASLRSIWTVSTTCSFPTVCEGQVSSDQGWTAPIYDKNGLWYVKRTVPNWEPCGDGTAAPGLQSFIFYSGDPNTGFSDNNSNSFFGQDYTIGQSGACGHNKPLEIAMPFKLIPSG
jgi:hypothetical protein